MCLDCLNHRSAGIPSPSGPSPLLSAKPCVRSWLPGKPASTELAAGRDREEQYEWLKERTDPASGLEIPLLDFLYQGGFRLPNVAQNRPSSEVASQPDFYYERDGAPGACIFVDGSDHLDPAQQERDASARTALEDRGYRVITIRFDRPREEQVARHSDVFGIGTRT